MLALPSWSTAEVEAPEVEREFEMPKEKGKLECSSKQYVCKKETEKESPKMTRLKPSFKKETKRMTKVQVRQLKVTPQKAQPKSRQLQLTKMATRIMPRALPKSDPKGALPKPFQMTKSSKSKPFVPTKAGERAKESVKEKARESAKLAQTERGEAQIHVAIRDCLDQDQSRKRKWSYEVDDDLGVAPTPRTFVATKSYNYKSLAPSEDKPFLVRPKLGVYALYYLLTKIGLVSDSKSHFDTKQQIRINQEETDLTHKQRLIEMKKAIDEEKSSQRWGVATQVFSWFTSFMGILTGIALIMTGVGVVAGALLLCAGLIMVTNQLMQLTGAWSKIAEKLPGSPEEKRKTLVWMQIGITVLCFLLSGAGVVFGGFTQVKQAMDATQAVAGGVIMMGYGTTSFGEGVSNYRHRNRMAKIREHQKKLAMLKHRREDLQEMVEGSVSRMEQLFEDLARLLEFETELFRADQAVIR